MFSRAPCDIGVKVKTKRFFEWKSRVTKITEVGDLAAVADEKVSGDMGACASLQIGPRIHPTGSPASTYTHPEGPSFVRGLSKGGTNATSPTQTLPSASLSTISLHAMVDPDVGKRDFNTAPKLSDSSLDRPQLQVPDRPDSEASLNPLSESDRTESGVRKQRVFSELRSSLCLVGKSDMAPVHFVPITRNYALGKTLGRYATCSSRL